MMRITASEEPTSVIKFSQALFSSSKRIEVRALMLAIQIMLVVSILRAGLNEQLISFLANK